ncbi:glycosyltransferase family 32 protein [Cyanobium sp. CH-040]|uniref:glycosyltransferase family 32 protein n=1 Tax=Cyanobium sp. CH-040 TaxID=2823708 RepID=UPI0020CC26C0|nr:glycosyltransferase [Cyanobium sp. CH-040]MCP9926727.1 hypothetical protein [Cyanobium sp. CH-040]
MSTLARATLIALEEKMINLVQFWHSPQAPQDVRALLASWERDPYFKYSRYDQKSADAFIGANFNLRVLEAYRKCAIPAMQADFFRYCFLYVNGGAYVDADTENSGRLNELLEGRSRGLLMNRERRVANDFLYVCSANDPLFARVIECATNNIEGRISNNVWKVTGPGIMTSLYIDPNTQSIFEGFDFLPARIVRDYVLFRHDLPYKSSEEDWRNARDSDKISIFSE